MLIITHFSLTDGPSHISISGEKTGLAGQTIHLDCIVQSHPPPTITWYKVAGGSSQVFGILLYKVTCVFVCE